MRWRASRIVAIAGLVLVHTAAPAHAVDPPPVDGRHLPAAQPPAPPAPTAQIDECAGAPEPAIGPADQLAGLDLSSVWALTRGAGQTVAVIDTGVSRHRRLPHLFPGGDYVSRHDGTADCDGHGTIVAGIIGAGVDGTDPGGFRGIAPDVSILAIRQASNKFHAITDPGGGVGDVTTLAAAVRTAADLGATVINISTVACAPAGIELGDESLGAALSYAVDTRNVVVVAAAGNVGGPGQCPDQNPLGAGADTVTTVASPAWYDDYVLTVGSVGPDGSASAFSLAGPWVDVAAPGEGVVSLASAGDGLVATTPSGDALSGTSYAAPVVAAVAALVRSRHPHLTAREVMRRIEDTAHHPSAGWDSLVGNGIIDPLAAVSGPGTPPPPSVSRPLTARTATTDPAPARRAVRAAVICLGVTAVIAAGSALLRRHRLASSTRPPD